MPKASGLAQKEHLEDNRGLVIVSMTEVATASRAKHGTHDAAVAEGVEDDGLQCDWLLRGNKCEPGKTLRRACCRSVSPSEKL